MEKYGPMDWRHPSAQGIYWMEEGYAKSLESRNREGRNELLVIRRRLNMIAELMRTGRINYDAVSDRIDLLPDPRFIPAYEAALTEAIGMIRSEAGVTTQHWGRADVDDLLKGWERFLNEATIMAYVYGDEPKANECFQKLVKLAQEQGMGDQPIYRESLQTFVTLSTSTTPASSWTGCSTGPSWTVSPRGEWTSSTGSSKWPTRSTTRSTPSATRPRSASRSRWTSARSPTSWTRVSRG
ncbi:hypothetical protein EBR04_00220 [bacterium]|nr:hypothetical protein [bacterium]